MAKSPEEAMAAMAANLAAKTGKTIDEWVAIVAKLGPVKHGEVVAHLKSAHGLGHGYANMVAHTARGSASSTAAEGTDLVAAQYVGPKAALRPIYDKLLAAVQGFGGDIDVSPKKAYVSLRRSKQFAIVQPSTATRVDVGINLKGVKPAGRLEASGSFNAMVTHRVRVESVKDVDAELIGWLHKAYDAA
jgi:Domain of unknown function (DUF5655)/Domain of unknown function (DUF4287)